MRALRAPLLSLALVAGLMITGAAPAAADDGDGPWQQGRLDASRHPVLSSGLGEIYTGEISTPDEVRATPTITDGKMFVGNHDSGYLQAFDLASGEQLWQAQAPNWVHSEMVHREGSVMVGYGNRTVGEDGIRGTGDSGVLSLDTDTGEVNWQLETAGEVMPTPAVVGDSVYIATGDRHLYEIDPETGEDIERADLGGNVNMSHPAVSDGMLYVGASGRPPNVLTAYDTDADDIAWQREFEETRSMGDVPPAVADGVVVITAPITLPEGEPEDGVHERHMIYAVDAETGELLWDDELGVGPTIENNRSGAPMIDDGTVFVGSPLTEASYAYDLQSGERLWTYHSGAVKGAPVARDGAVFFSTTSGWIHALDEETGEKLGERHLGGALAPSGPVIVDDVLVVGSQDGSVYLTPLSEILDTPLAEGVDVPLSESIEDDASAGTTVLLVALSALVLALLAVVVLQRRRLVDMRGHRHPQ